MTVLLWTIPLMLVAIAVALVPIIVAMRDEAAEQRAAIRRATVSPFDPCGWDVARSDAA